MTKSDDALPDHLGWRLWLASRQWQAQFVAAMRHAGHVWFTDARANLLAHIARGGTLQSVIVDRMGVSKQAVQQLVDGLTADGIVERIADPDDSRSRIVRYTPAGMKAMRDADRIKRRVEDAYRERLGDARFDVLMRTLRELTEKPATAEHD